ncbi:hypothetical protein DFH11DRAFT_53629 [Phellopilus nigrolimitatus]|nr:hypothetical protein DFH11DRAFT_53629 [Phellopilus nigrolimitatus]
MRVSKWSLIAVGNIGPVAGLLWVVAGYWWDMRDQYGTGAGGSVNLDGYAESIPPIGSARSVTLASRKTSFHFIRFILFHFGKVYVTFLVQVHSRQPKPTRTAERPFKSPSWQQPSSSSSTACPPPARRRPRRRPRRSLVPAAARRSFSSVLGSIFLD